MKNIKKELFLLGINFYMNGNTPYYEAKFSKRKDEGMGREELVLKGDTWKLDGLGEGVCDLGSLIAKAHGEKQYEYEYEFIKNKNKRA